METIEFKGVQYPKLQSEGFAAQYAFPFANKILKGTGVDIGCNRHEWCLPGAIPIDPAIEGCVWNAYNLGGFSKLDYCFTSHCYEHLDEPIKALEHWYERLREGGILFMYLPNMDEQQYWRPFNNRKHKFYLNPEIMELTLKEMLWKQIVVTKGADLNASFYAIATK